MATSTWWRELISIRHPDEVVHAYDHDWRPVARTQIYPGYKSERPPEPEDLTRQFALLRDVLDSHRDDSRRTTRTGRPRTRSAA